MSDAVSHDRAWNAGFGALAGLVSGVISANLVLPGSKILEQVGFLQDTLVGLLSMLALTAGLTFGVIGAVFVALRLRVGPFGAMLWFAASIIGMGAAFYASILIFDNRTAPASYVLPYLVASPIGALILGGAIAAVRPYARKLRLLATLVAAPTAWAVFVAFVMLGATSDDALSVPWMLALFGGWQAIFLGIVAGWRGA